MILSQQVKNIILLLSIEGLGRNLIMKFFTLYPELIDNKLTPNHIKRFLPEFYERFSKTVKTIDDLFLQIILSCKKNNINICSIFDTTYPDQLRHVHDPPLILFYKGELKCEFEKSIAFVGTRKPSLSGKNVTKFLIDKLSDYTFSIVSGLASGVDMLSHGYALKNNMHCVGVVGHGLEHAYPAKSVKVYDEIISNGGCIISEYLPWEKPKPYYFPQRNRIIAGLVKSVVVIEAASKSGSLITAKHAFEEGRTVFAIPTAFNNYQYNGCNELIHNGIAQLLLKPENIIDEYKLNSSDLSIRNNKYSNVIVRPNDFIEVDKNISQNILATISSGAHTIDEIILQTRLDYLDVVQAITELEIYGNISRSTDGKLFVAD